MKKVKVHRFFFRFFLLTQQQWFFRGDGNYDRIFIIQTKQRIFVSELFWKNIHFRYLKIFIDFVKLNSQLGFVIIDDNKFKSHFAFKYIL